MAKIKIRIPDPGKVFNEKYLPLVLGEPETLKPIIILEGGRGSAKSREVAQLLTKRSLENKLRIGLVRKVADTIRDSQYREIQDVVEEWGLSSEFRFLTSPLSVKNTAGSSFIARGLDKSTKIKSIANVDIIWIEEAEELTKQDWIDLSLSVRGEKKSEGGIPKQIILTFNRSAGNWTEDEFFLENGEFKENPNIYHLHTTFQDNKFLDRAFLERLEQMKQDDPELYQKNALGLPIKLKGVIYTWKSAEKIPEACKDILFGLDFGYHPDPTVLLRIGRLGMHLYVEQLIYDTKLTNSDLIRKMNEMGLSKTTEIYADGAEPDRIEEISRAGYNIFPADKGPGSVEFGIDILKRYTIHILSNSTDVRKDFGNYKWKTDRDGETVSPPTPAHFGSHAPDATRYPVATHWGKEYLHLTEKDLRTVVIEEKETERMNTSVEFEVTSSHSLNAY